MINKCNKKIAFAICIMLTAVFLSACDKTVCSRVNFPEHLLKTGIYKFEKATLTNLDTDEVLEILSTDEIYSDALLFIKWKWLLSFSINIEEATEFIIINNRIVTIDEGLCYEYIDKNTLKLHFTRWLGYVNGVYDVVIIFGCKGSI